MSNKSASVHQVTKERFAAYYRVSTQSQGINGLGMAAQKHSVETFLQRKPDYEFTEVESGTRKDRPQLEAAIALCRRTKAMLVVAKLDRLARDCAFVLNLRNSGIEFTALDAPFANKMTITILAAVAEQERDWISERTKAGLQAAKARGTKLGTPMRLPARRKAIATLKRKASEFALSMAPVLAEIQQAGVTTLKGMALCLNRRGFKTAMGASWTRQAVSRLQRRLS